MPHVYTENAHADRKPVTAPALRAMKDDGRKIVMLTAYDASFAARADEAGIDVVLVGDSLGMVVQGHASTLPVTLDQTVYHTAAVSRGLSKALLVADLPFMSDRDPAFALEAARRLMGEGGAAMVKLEGAGHICGVIEALVERNVPVCAHLGLTPQSVHRLGGYRVQGREEAVAEQILADAHAVAAAGAQLLVLEAVPAELAARITRELDIPTIGIGAGADTDGQVLVVYDMLGITPGKRPKFSKDFLAGRGSVVEAMAAFADDVRDGRFPAAEHQY
ncbi:3-methyl-2-oxobutanoate hydroxymethyltransferase [Oleiagrimonas soli]|uniref:3-methyl-2-oxobutanoate hydroxymethyltransferase n=1 Tax=Oleiagrimonas soli TaxID=1543381 RepID=A0A099CVX1_9GAMM|nr:3-methyl-2-oxobutanoate hydroxymethyltransferase [Oleiagrimonas soli]KGI77904.1 3-methyl-2-oxobutanoate hydroxymethyltransferase [Oleiagrimonas soli]